VSSRWRRALPRLAWSPSHTQKRLAMLPALPVGSTLAVRARCAISSAATTRANSFVSDWRFRFPGRARRSSVLLAITAMRHSQPKRKPHRAASMLAATLTPRLPGSPVMHGAAESTSRELAAPPTITKFCSSACTRSKRACAKRSLQAMPTLPRTHFHPARKPKLKPAATLTPAP
jgi:hypothetical protein